MSAASCNSASGRPGGLLVEVVVGLALGILFAIAIVTMGIGTFESVDQSRSRLVAIHYASEGLEEARSIARQNFNQLRLGTYGTNHTGTKFVLTGSGNTMGKYWRALTISPAFRDTGNALLLDPANSGSILAAGGWEDTQVRLVTSTVTWYERGLTRSVSSKTVLSKWFVYPLQTSTATGELVGSEYEFTPIDGGTFPHWKAIFWNLDGGVSQMHVRVGDTYAELVSNNWIGPTGDSGSYYNIWGSGLHSNSAGSGRWIQAKAWLTGTGSAAPILSILHE